MAGDDGPEGRDAFMRVGDLHHRRLADDHRAGARQVLAEAADEIERAFATRLFVIAQENMDRPPQAGRLEAWESSPARWRRNPSCRRSRAHRGGRRRCASVKGSLVHFCPATGTTSVWPERTIPPSTIGPIVASSAALSPAALGARSTSTPCAAQIVLDEIDQRQIALVAFAVERHQALEKRNGARLDVVAHPASPSAPI